jgi:hypothetical protein
MLAFSCFSFCVIAVCSALDKLSGVKGRVVELKKGCAVMHYPGQGKLCTLDNSYTPIRIFSHQSLV